MMSRVKSVVWETLLVAIAASLPLGFFLALQPSGQPTWWPTAYARTEVWRSSWRRVSRPGGTVETSSDGTAGQEAEAFPAVGPRGRSTRGPLVNSADRCGRDLSPVRSAKRANTVS